MRFESHFKNLLFLLVLTLSTLGASEVLNFDKLTNLTSQNPNEVKEILADYVDQEVVIRGFIFKNDDGKYVLSSRPGLASCCQRVEENIPHQIFLEGNDFLASGGKTVSVQGFLTIDPVWNHEGRVIELYRMKDPKISDFSNEMTWIILLIIICGAGLSIWLTRRRRTSLP